MKRGAVLIIAILVSLSQAIPAHGVKQHLSLANQSDVLFIVHPSRTWDPLALVKSEINQLYGAFLKLGKKVYIFKHNDQLIDKNYPQNVNSYYNSP